MMKFLGVLCVVFGSLSSWAQVEFVDTNQINTVSLNESVNRFMSAERRKNRLDSLHWDPTLTAMTKHHLDYMLKHQVVGHLEKLTHYETPLNRADQFGCNHNVLYENVQSVDLRALILKAKGRYSYLKLGKLIAEKWLKSPSDANTFLTDAVVNYNRQIAFKNGVLFICQTVASRPFIPQFDYVEGEQIFVKNKKPCYNCKQTTKKINNGYGYVGWYKVQNDSVYFMTTEHYLKNKHLKNNIRLIFGGNGMVSVDVIHQRQYGCQGDAAYDRALNSDGYYLGTVTKADLENDIHPSPELYQIYVGQVPAFADTFYQVDLNLIKRNRPCMQSNIIFVNPDFLEPEEYFLMPRPTLSESKVVRMQEEVEIKVNFERGKTNEDTTIFQPLVAILDSLNALDLNITSIAYTGVASVEGSEQINKQLIDERGELIGAYLKNYYPHLSFKSSFFENFDDLRSSLALAGYTEQAEMENAALRKWINAHASDKDIKQMLDDSRYSEVVIAYVFEQQLVNENYMLSVQHIHDLIDEENAAQAQVYYRLAAHKAMAGDEVIKDSLLLLNIPLKSNFGSMKWDEKVFMFNVVPDYELSPEELKELKSYNSWAGKLENELEYQFIFNLFYGHHNFDVDFETFDETLEQVKSKRTKAWLKSLELIYGVESGKFGRDSCAKPSHS